MGDFLRQLIATTFVFLEGLLLPLEVFLLLMFKSSPLAYASEQMAVHHFPNVAAQSLDTNSAPTHALPSKKSDSCLEASPPTSTSALPLLRRTMTWEEKYAHYAKDMGSSTRSMWSEPSAEKIQVRGPKYLKDGVKVPAGLGLGKLLHVDVWSETPERPGRQDHIARIDLARPNSILRYFQEERPDDTIFVLNFQVPGPPFVHVVCYWVLAAETVHSNAPFLRLWKQFRGAIDTGNHTFCNARMKLIPAIADGPWLVKATVPQKPAIIGNKLTQRYFAGTNYVEVAMDIASSTIAANIVGLCRGYSKQLVVDLHLTLQGDVEEELPERIFGSVQLAHLDFTQGEAIPLPL
ncbi:Aste57867_13887 [Aphanomyces stellatus]|uniref:Aste57867_13887 protein n=1 Tax=Aphanomyces stellatus TaxID=120398 RepID=A0A485KZV0_9STRA|nr:hypothetical protein As57867_013836 [Aphanomyces stellatus]VFT90718.1 Aste57867_13887 [Aphanomyces stellatus]